MTPRSPAWSRPPPSRPATRTSSGSETVGPNGSCFRPWTIINRRLETHRRARIRAAELDTSVSALVREFLRRLAPRGRRRERQESPPLESALECRRRLFDEVFADFDARGVGLRMADNLPRAALHDQDYGGIRVVNPF